MSKNQPNNPLHGITLEAIVTSLHEQYGWDGLAQKINVNCFKNDPSVKSSLKFLRKTPWARSQVEDLYVSSRKTPSPWDKASEQFQASNTTENSEDEL
ncbi:VF530 family DNA-binding protein [Luminiphilus sp. nBUS_16]|uniref:VF530 family protein n=1 Tax=Luminiphilus sp. nBUS_16 TaxID=3395315 RepID=UPI003EBD2862